MKPRALPAGIQEKLYEMLQGAASGAAELTWLHSLVQRAGYVRFDGGAGAVLVTAKQLEHLLGRSMRSVRMLINEGLPCAKPGVGAAPSLFEAKAVLDWMKIREAPKSPKEQEAIEKLREEQYKAAKRKNDKEDGLVIETEKVGQIIDGVNKAFLDRAKSIEQVFGPAVGGELRDMITEWYEGAKDGLQRAS